ncbi:MAG: hypothetical protein U1F30_12365 [Steroidobacteraceae bacterium]
MILAGPAEIRAGSATRHRPGRLQGAGRPKELGYAGWVIVESDKGPQPVASSILLNSWYVQNTLLPLLR